MSVLTALMGRTACRRPQLAPNPSSPSRPSRDFTFLDSKFWLLTPIKKLLFCQTNPILPNVSGPFEK